MADRNSHSPERHHPGVGDDVDSLLEETADGLAEILADTALQFEKDEARSIASELVKNFTSPLMIQRAAGATSQVTIVANPAGGTESGRSVKARNMLINLRTTAFALPSTLPTLLAVYERNGTPDHVRLTMAAVIALYGWLTVSVESNEGVSICQNCRGLTSYVGVER